MHFYSSETVTKPADSRINDIKFESNATHHMMLVPWEHCYEDTIDVKVTNLPFKIEANSYDGLNYHRMTRALNLNYDIVSLDGTFYDLYDEGFCVHIPKENMKRRNVETVSLSRK